MTVEQLSSEFNLIYKDIETYATKASRALNSPADLSSILAECYLHVYKSRDQIHTRQDLEAYSKNWVKQNLRWSHSPLHRLVNSRGGHTQIEEWHVSQDLTDLWSMYETAVDSFLPLLNNYDRRLWSMYVEQDLTSGKAIAKHLEMSNSTGFQILRECKSLLNRFRTHLLTQM